MMLKRKILISIVGIIATLSVAQASITVIENVKGYTLNDSGELVQFSQIVFEKDKIIGLDVEKYSNNEALRDKKSITFIDGNNQTLLPGLIDAHGHLLGLGENLTQVDLRSATSEQNAVELIKTFVGSRENDGWIIGRGWNQVNWPGKQFPSKQSLDEAFPDIPIMLTRVDGHASWVNSKALELAGINSVTVDPSGGEIKKLDTGEPSGVLIDNAMYLVEQVLPPVDNNITSNRLRTAQQHLLSLGITSMHDAGISRSVRDLYIEKAENQELMIRVYAMLAATDPSIKDMLSFGHYADENGFLSIRSVKAYGDGALGSRGAALLAPYSDDPDNTGLLVTPQNELDSLFDLVIGSDFQLNFHAIGDRANRLALQNFAMAFKEYPDNAKRHRIEHAQVVAPADIPLFKQFDIIPSMQPTHATSDKNMAQDRLGIARLRGAYAWQTFLKQGSRVAFGSDFPVELANPFHGLHAAVTRQDGNNQPEGGWLAEEKVSLEQALAGFTRDAAYAGFQDHMIGTLTPGKKADFILVDRDIFTIEHKNIRDTQVLETWVNGTLKYRAVD